MDYKCTNHVQPRLCLCMKISTSYSVNPDTERALDAAIASLQQQLAQPPQQVICYYTENHDPHKLRANLNTAFPDAVLQGCSTCNALMTAQGFHSHDGSALGLISFEDETGAYGSAAIASENAFDAGHQAVNQAITLANRTGELPDLVWLSATPGCEEEIIAGIQSVIGPDVPIAGGSAADNNVAGKWSLFNQAQILQRGVVLSVFYSDATLSYAFHSGYFPAGRSGTVTRCSDRTIYEIDGRPAVEVYKEWTEGRLSDQLSGPGSILAHTTLFPLGRQVSTSSDLYKLSHPEAISDDGGLVLFTRIAEGEKVCLMQGSIESLINRAGRVTTEAIYMEDFSIDNIAGAIVIYCAGCMLTVRDHMPRVVDSITAAIPSVPFMGAFTFGEQGCLLDAGNTHGNLMISAMLFGK